MSGYFKKDNIMEKEKKPMTELEKMKRIYTIELIVLSLVAITLAILRLTRVINPPEERRLVYTWITLFAGFLAWGNLVWYIASPKRRKKACLLDILLPLPSATFLIVVDIIHLATGLLDLDFYRMYIVILFFYIAAIYIVMAIYHYFRPLPAFLALEDDEETKKLMESEQMKNANSEFTSDDLEKLKALSEEKEDADSTNNM
jgi:hypothetical protein